MTDGPGFCEACGAKLHADAKFCGSCGHDVPLAEPPPKATAPVRPEPSATVSPPPPQAAATPDSGTQPVVGGDDKHRKRPMLLFALIGAVAVLGIAAGILLAGGGGDDANAEVLLESAAKPGAHPFTPPVDPPDPAQTAVLVDAQPESGTTPAPGSPLYGGSGDDRVCDREAMVRFLTANPAQGKAWAGVAGIPTASLASYIRSLTPTVLLYDTRVTNHSFSGGRATPLQSVLQAGTAVLIDSSGQPIAKCKCGNPLRPPVKTTSTPHYTGAKWPGFTPSETVAVATTPTTNRGASDAPYKTTTGAVDCGGALTEDGKPLVQDPLTLALTVTDKMVTIEVLESVPALQLPPTRVESDGTFKISYLVPPPLGPSTLVVTGTIDSGHVEGRYETTVGTTKCSATFTGQVNPKKAPTTTTPARLIDGTYTLGLTPGTYCGLQVNPEAATMTVQGNTMTLTGTNGSSYPGTVERTGRKFHMVISAGGVTGTIDGTIDNAGNITGSESLTGDMNCQLPFTGRRN